MKKKSLITMLAALVVFAISATCVFAVSQVGDFEWNADYTVCTVTESDGDVDYDKISKTFVAGNATGEINAQIDTAKYSTTPASNGATTYYDLNNSAIDIPEIWSRADFDNAASDGVLLTGARGIVFNNAGITTGQVVKSATVPALYGGTLDPTSTTPATYQIVYKYFGFDEDSVAEQTVTVTAMVRVLSTQGNAIEDSARLVGEIPAATITVKAKAQKGGDIQFEADKLLAGSPKISAGTATLANVPYDGDTHTIVNDTVEGWTVSYALQDPKTGVYKAVDKVQFRDVDTYNFKITATPADTTKEQAVSCYGAVTVVKAGAFNFKWKTMAISPASGYVEVPTTADPLNYVEAVTGTPGTYEAVADSDAAEAMKYFGEVYEIKTTADAADASLVTWSIKVKKDVPTDLAKRYETLLANYDATVGASGNITGSADQPVKLVQGALVKDHIVVDAPDKVTYKAKKLKKKAASFTVEAKAKSGNAVTYSMSSTSKKISIDPTSGKVTVAKGLKKGTYKVKVYCETAAGNGYAAADNFDDPVKITIKVKK